jgi:hypothetical protein
VPVTVTTGMTSRFQLELEVFCDSESDSLRLIPIRSRSIQHSHWQAGNHWQAASGTPRPPALQVQVAQHCQWSGDFKFKPLSGSGCQWHRMKTTTIRVMMSESESRCHSGLGWHCVGSPTRSPARATPTRSRCSAVHALHCTTPHRTTTAP